MKIRVLDIFCGAGGSSAGARLAGAVIVRGIDACDLATATFRDNFADAVVETRELGPSSLPDCGMQEGEIDLLMASPQLADYVERLPRQWHPMRAAHFHLCGRDAPDGSIDVELAPLGLPQFARTHKHVRRKA